MADSERDPAKSEQTTRREFIEKVVKRAAIVGGLLAAPQVLDKFLVPKAWAYGSSCASQATAVADTNANNQGDTGQSSGGGPGDNTSGQGNGGAETLNNSDTICSTNQR